MIRLIALPANPNSTSATKVFHPLPHPPPPPVYTAPTSTVLVHRPIHTLSNQLLREEEEKKRIHKCMFKNCNKMYTKSSHLKAHQRTHTGELSRVDISCIEWSS